MRSWSILVSGGILIVMGFVMAFSIKDDSPTFDEPPHILSGYSALAHGHNFIDVEHPLLAKTLAAVPLLFQDTKINLTDPDYVVQENGLDIGRLFETSRDFLNYSGNNPDQILFSTRLVMIFLTCAFGVVIFLFAQRLFGPLAAVLAVGVYATEPNILANGALVNTDAPAMGFVLLSLFALYLYSQSQTNKRLAFLTLALTAAFLSKFSTFYLLPLALFAIYWLNGAERKRAYAHVAWLSLGCVALVSVFYGLLTFRDRGVFGFLPWVFVEGLVRIFISVSVEGRYNYLLGESYTGGRPYYFPIMLATKTQLLTLFGFALSLGLIWFRKIRLSKRTLLVTLGPVTVLFVVALISKFNIGVRHILPIYPILIIFAAGGFVTTAHLINEKLKLKKTWVVLFVLVLIITIIRFWSIATTYPHFLSYYNQLVGGADNGWRVANDANYDWGQDVKRLAKYVKENNITSIAFDNYSGNYAAKGYYNIPVTDISPKDINYKGYLALSTSVITFHEDKQYSYSWVTDNYKPIARAGKSIFIYKIE